MINQIGHGNGQQLATVLKGKIPKTLSVI